MTPSLYYPVKPIHINQIFGANVAYYEAHFGQAGHPGIDFMATTGQPVYAAHDGNAIYIKDKYGGEGIWNYSLDGSFVTIYWHLIGDTDATYKLPIPFDQQRHAVKAGDLIGYADNTGAPYESSGTHLHFGLAFLKDGALDPTQGIGGCSDPEPYFNGIAAQDIAQLTSLEITLVGVLTKLRDYLLRT